MTSDQIDEETAVCLDVCPTSTTSSITCEDDDEHGRTMGTSFNGWPRADSSYIFQANFKPNMANSNVFSSSINTQTTDTQTSEMDFYRRGQYLEFLIDSR